jgi:hypothetical protein
VRHLIFFFPYHLVLYHDCSISGPFPRADNELRSENLATSQIKVAVQSHQLTAGRTLAMVSLQGHCEAHPAPLLRRSEDLLEGCPKPWRWYREAPLNMHSTRFVSVRSKSRDMRLGPGCMTACLKSLSRSHPFSMCTSRPFFYSSIRLSVLQLHRSHFLFRKRILKALRHNSTPCLMVVSG